MPADTTKAADANTALVIGAGPSGLVSARYLQSEGFAVTIFERNSTLGGQWSQTLGTSGVWDNLVINTSYLQTGFSDYEYPPDTRTYPHHSTVKQYLTDYAKHGKIYDRIQYNSQVVHVKQNTNTNDSASRWLVTVKNTQTGATTEHSFTHIVIASGRYNKPHYPTATELKGQDTFTGSAGIVHGFNYRSPQAYIGKRVVVIGSNLTGVELSSELAFHTQGAAHVFSAVRRQRYIAQKLIAGIPIDNLAFTRASLYAEETLPVDAVLTGLTSFLKDKFGIAETYGLKPPLKTDENLAVAGLTQAQYYLPLVAEGRITVKANVREINGRTVTFDDGTVAEDIDGIVLATGYDIDLDYLDESIRRDVLHLDNSHIDLYHYTFHPQLPGLAFIGFPHIFCATWGVWEQQARWIAYTFSGSTPQASYADQLKAIEQYKQQRAQNPSAIELACHTLTVLFARNNRVEPNPADFPEIAHQLLFGPLLSASFRLTGHDSLPNATELIKRRAATFGAIPQEEGRWKISAEQLSLLQALASAADKAKYKDLDTLIKQFAGVDLTKQPVEEQKELQQDQFGVPRQNA